MQGHKCLTVNVTVLGLIPTRGNQIFIYFFSFLRSDNKAKRSVEFRRQTCNISLNIGTEILWERSILTLGSLLCAGCSVEQKNSRVIRKIYKTTCFVFLFYIGRKLSCFTLTFLILTV